MKCRYVCVMDVGPRSGQEDCILVENRVFQEESLTKNASYESDVLLLAVCDGKAVIGLPGNPVSALVIASLFVVPVVERLLGLPPERPHPQVAARLTINLASQAGREDWIPVRLLDTPQGGYLAEPIFFKSNLIFTLAQADGLLHIPADATGLAGGEPVWVLLL